MIKKTFHALFLARKKEVPFLMLLGFVVTFLGARGVVKLIYSGFLPEWFFFRTEIYGQEVHIHHFVYGIIILAIIGFLSLAIPRVIEKMRHILAFAYGAGISLIVDELALWLYLPTDTQEHYYSDLSVDGITALVGLLLLIVYFPPFWRWFTRYWKKKFHPQANEQDS